MKTFYAQFAEHDFLIQVEAASMHDAFIQCAAFQAGHAHSRDLNLIALTEKKGRKMEVRKLW